MSAKKTARAGGAACVAEEGLRLKKTEGVRIIRVESSIVIDRPPEEVFAYATDPAHAPEWQSSALETVVDGPVQAGASGKEVRKFLGRRMESTMRIERLSHHEDLPFRSPPAQSRSTLSRRLSRRAKARSSPSPLRASRAGSSSSPTHSSSER